MKNFFGIVLLVVLFVIPFVVLGQFDSSTGGSYDSRAGSSYDPRAGGSNFFSVQNPLGDVTDFNTLLKKLLDAAIIIGIPIAVLFIVWAGFKFVFAMGNAEKLKDARRNFLYTIIGIGIFLGAWLIARVLSETIRQLGAPLQ